MSRSEVDGNHVESVRSGMAFMNRDNFEQSSISDDSMESAQARRRANGMRRTPRKSLIVVLPDDHVVSPDTVTERRRAEGDSEEADVIVACAGHPLSLAALQRRVRDLQVLLAPAGTSHEDLRELAIHQAPGDIVSLLSGTPVQGIEG